MRAKKANKSRAGPAVMTVVVMRLYIANLEAICKEHLQEGFKLEIIDVLEFPLRALADGVLVTPHLAKLAPSPAAKIVGNLSDRSNVLHALGIKS